MASRTPQSIRAGAYDEALDPASLRALDALVRRVDRPERHPRFLGSQAHREAPMFSPERARDATADAPGGSRKGGMASRSAPVGTPDRARPFDHVACRW